MSRIKSVDGVRVFAILAVIVIHTNPFSSWSSTPGGSLDLATTFNQLARFAVPCFFVLSGYFWADKWDSAQSIVEPTIKMAKRIGLIFVVWSAIYLLPTDIAGSFSHGPLGPLKVIFWGAITALSHPLTTILQGTKGHLWFLPSLLLSLVISAVFLRRGLQAPLIVVSILLFLVGLDGGAYSNTPIGFHIDFNFRNGPFFGLIFFVTGYLLQRRGPDPAWLQLGIGMAFAGFCLHLLEIWALNSYSGMNMLHDYVIGTYFTGVGVALIALSNTRILDNKALSFIGPMVLGIYSVHYAIIDMLKPAAAAWAGSLYWEIGQPVLVFAASVGISYALSQFRLTKQIVG